MLTPCLHYIKTVPTKMLTPNMWKSNRKQSWQSNRWNMCRNNHVTSNTWNTFQTTMTRNMRITFKTKHCHPIGGTISNTSHTVSKQFQTHVNPISNTHTNLKYVSTHFKAISTTQTISTTRFKLPSVRARCWDMLVHNLSGITETAFMWNTAFSNGHEHKMKPMTQTCWGHTA